MSPLKQSTNIAARMGRWSARHRKTAIFGWLAFVVASVVLGMTVGMKTIDETDWNVGEARQADHIIRDAGFKLDEQMEYVLVQSKSTTARDPEFRAVVNQAIAERMFVTLRAVEKHVTSIFTKLDLPASSDDHRRVLAVLAFLQG